MLTEYFPTYCDFYLLFVGLNICHFDYSHVEQKRKELLASKQAEDRHEKVFLLDF